MTEILPCLLLPLTEKNIILPSSAVVEIMSYEKPNLIPEIPDWLVGILIWRGIHVPLVYLEKVESHLVWNQGSRNQQDEGEGHSRYMAIINRVNRSKSNLKEDEHGNYPFMSIVLKGVPKLYRISKDNIKKVADRHENDFRFMMEVKIQNDFAFVPDLTQVWNMIDGLPPRLQWFRQIIL